MVSRNSSATCLGINVGSELAKQNESKLDAVMFHSTKINSRSKILEIKSPRKIVSIPQTILFLPGNCIDLPRSTTV